MAGKGRPQWQDEYHAMLSELLGRYSPASLLAIGHRAQRDLESWLDAHGDARMKAEPDMVSAANRLSQLGIQDFALISADVDPLSREAMGILIARLRDLYARRTFVLLASSGRASGQRWSHTDMVGAGFSRLRSWALANGDTVAFYGFDIDNYKTTPDWLNSRYWAHPELFDKYRW